MDAVVKQLIETSIVGGAFIYMLFYITKNFKDALDNNTDKLELISSTLQDMNNRLTKLEEKE